MISFLDDKPTWKYLLLSVITYFSYEVLNIFYMIEASVILEISGIPSEVYLKKHYFFFDSVFCAVFLLLVAFALYVFSKEKQTDLYSQIRQREHPYCFTKDLGRLIIITLGLGGISFFWLTFAESLLSVSEVLQESLESFQSTWEDVSSEAYIWVFLSVVFLGPIVEEILFRGFLFHFLEKIHKGWFPIILSGILFGIWHGEPVQVVYTAIIGLGLGIIFAKTRSMKAVIFVHILNNLLSTLPPFLDKEGVYVAINVVSVGMIFPAEYLLYGWGKQLQITFDREKISRKSPEKE